MSTSGVCNSRQDHVRFTQPLVSNWVCSRCELITAPCCSTPTLMCSGVCVVFWPDLRSEIEYFSRDFPMQHNKYVFASIIIIKAD